MSELLFHDLIPAERPVPGVFESMWHGTFPPTDPDHFPIDNTQFLHDAPPGGDEAVSESPFQDLVPAEKPVSGIFQTIWQRAFTSADAGRSPFNRSTDESPPSPVRINSAETVDGPDILSDADSEPWIPGEQYAQNPRGRGGPSWRELSPLQGYGLLRYQSAFTTLRELEPGNPQLLSLSTPTWVPTSRDVNRLNEEIARVKRERGLSELEAHHNFPRQFAANFRACGIEPEDHITYLPRSLHRLTPNGLHSGPYSWNVQWGEFLRDRDNMNPERYFEQLHNMWKGTPWVQP